ncbi:hypothetical protein [Amycolatopsis sp. NPDC051903]|uniref:hypothetical protein n=1 Tax=Amycolatopsis sp. NPDC051903 TaxID=3363936 RepID=UPI0037B45005
MAGEREGVCSDQPQSAQWQKGQSADAGTRQTVNSHLKTGIFRFLGDKPLKLVEKTDTIRDWLGWLERPKKEGVRGLMASYRAILFERISAILQAAADDNKIRSNPCRAKSIKRPRKSRSTSATTIPATPSASTPTLCRRATSALGPPPTRCSPRVGPPPYS